MLRTHVSLVLGPGSASAGEFARLPWVAVAKNADCPGATQPEPRVGALQPCEPVGTLEEVGQELCTA